MATPSSPRVTNPRVSPASPPPSPRAVVGVAVATPNSPRAGTGAGRGTGRGVATVTATAKPPAGGQSPRRLPDLKSSGSFTEDADAAASAAAAPVNLSRQSGNARSVRTAGCHGINNSAEQPSANRVRPLPPAKPRPKAQTMSMDPEPLPSPPRSFLKAVPRKELTEVAPANTNRTSAPKNNRMSTVFSVSRIGVPPEIQQLPTAVALEDYDAENHRELSFKKDDVIHVVFWSPSTVWWKGWFNGQIGYFPKEGVRPRFELDDTNSQAVAVASRTADSQDRKRRQLIASIATSEELHVKDLQVIQEVLVGNLQTVLTTADIMEIFGDIDLIVNESKDMLVLFQRKVRTEEPVGDVFLRMAEMFAQHVVPWAANQVHMVCALEKLNSSNSGFASCLQSIAEQCRGLSIYEWLSKPARRATECQQIIALLLNKTPAGHVDHAALSEANDIMTLVKDELRGPGEELDGLLKIVTLQNSLQGQESLVSPSRKFVREAALHEVVGKKPSERRAYLLSDQLVVVKQKTTGFAQPVFFPLHPSRTSVATVADAGPLRCMFELTVNQAANKKDKVRFAMASAAERDSFVKAIETQIALCGTQGARSNSDGSVAPPGFDTVGKKSGFIKILRPGPRASSVIEEAAPAVSPMRASTRTPSGGSAAAAAGVTPAASSAEGQNSPPPQVGSKPSSGSSFARLSPRANASSPDLRTRVSEATPQQSSRRDHPAALAKQNTLSTLPSNGSSPAPTRSPRATASVEEQLAESMSEVSMSRQSGVVCSKCQEVIVGNALNIKNKYYHNECYKCSNCDVSLLVVPFAEKKGVPFCRDCAISMFAEPCASCARMITGAYLAAFGVKYHPACFLCAGGCGRNVSNGYANRNNKAYCKACVKTLKE